MIPMQLSFANTKNNNQRNLISSCFEEAKQLNRSSKPCPLCFPLPAHGGLTAPEIRGFAPAHYHFKHDLFTVIVAEKFATGVFKTKQTCHAWWRQHVIDRSSISIFLANNGSTTPRWRFACPIDHLVKRPSLSVHPLVSARLSKRPPVPSSTDVVPRSPDHTPPGCKQKLIENMKAYSGIYV